jgi:hypothetical protein
MTHNDHQWWRQGQKRLVTLVGQHIEQNELSNRELWWPMICNCWISTASRHDSQKRKQVRRTDRGLASEMDFDRVQEVRDLPQCNMM